MARGGDLRSRGTLPRKHGIKLETWLPRDYSFILRLRQIAYCLHIRVIDCHTPVYLIHPVYPVYPCISSIPLYMYRPSGYYKVRTEDLHLALRNVIKLYFASLKSRFSKVQSCLNILNEFERHHNHTRPVH